MLSSHITFIGAGNMAGSLIGGLIANGMSPASMRAADPDMDRRNQVGTRHGIETFGDNATAIAGADTVVLAVKPQTMAAAVADCAVAIADAKPLVISVAAGVRTADIRHWLGYEAAVVRSMPNTPALLGCGASGLFANPFVSVTQRARAESILGAVGITEWVEDEALLDAVTGVSGSGPAYFFLLMECMEAAGRELGLSAEAARRLTLQTALGAARMALEGGESPAVLRERVTSPKGTTERAIAILLDGGLPALIDSAVSGACRRAVELGDSLSEQ